MYYKLKAAVKWNGFESANLPVFSGVRRDGVLSPLLVNCYVDRIISQLKCAGLGYHIANCCVGCIMYVRDLLLMSSSVLELHKCQTCVALKAVFFDIIFNHKK